MLARQRPMVAAELNVGMMIESVGLHPGDCVSCLIPLLFSLCIQSLREPLPHYPPRPRFQEPERSTVTTIWAPILKQRLLTDHIRLPVNNEDRSITRVLLGIPRVIGDRWDKMVRRENFFAFNAKVG